MSLSALFASSFLAATLLPGGSEFVLAGVLQVDPQQYWPALGVATLGNTLGGMSGLSASGVYRKSRADVNYRPKQRARYLPR